MASSWTRTQATIDFSKRITGLTWHMAQGIGTNRKWKVDTSEYEHRNKNIEIVRSTQQQEQQARNSLIVIHLSFISLIRFVTFLYVFSSFGQSVSRACFVVNRPRALPKLTLNGDSASAAACII